MTDSVRRSAVNRGVTRIVGFIVSVPIGILIGWIGGFLVNAATG